MTEEQEKAQQLFNSFRGKYIISYALSLAGNLLKNVPFPHTELSDIEDIFFMRDQLFPLYRLQEESVKKIMELKLLKGGEINEKGSNNNMP